MAKYISALEILFYLTEYNNANSRFFSPFLKHLHLCTYYFTLKSKEN